MEQTQPNPMKSGLKTSEFWFAVLNHLVCLGLLAGIWYGEFAPSFEYAEELLMAAAIGPQAMYTHSRTKLKTTLMNHEGSTS